MPLIECYSYLPIFRAFWRHCGVFEKHHLPAFAGTGVEEGHVHFRNREWVPILDGSSKLDWIAQRFCLADRVRVLYKRRYTFLPGLLCRCKLQRTHEVFRSLLTTCNVHKTRLKFIPVALANICVQEFLEIRQWGCPVS